MLFVIFAMYLCFLLITILILWRGFSLYQLKLSNNFISRNAIFFSSNSEEKKQVFSDIHNRFKKLDFTLYNKIHEDEITTVLSVFFEGKTITPKVEQGRYFVSQDFFSNRKVAVIGKDIINTDYIIKDDNNFYLLLYDEKFDVIGIMNYGQGVLNKTIFINMDSVEKQLTNVFCIDNVSKSDVKKIVDDLKYKYSISLLNFQNSILDTIIDLDKQSLFLLDFALIIVYLFLIIIIINYFRYLKEELYVYRILGFNFINILKYLLLKINYIIVTVICLFGFSMIFVVNFFIYEEKLLSIYMALMSIIFFISSIYIFVFLFVILIWYKKISYIGEG